MDNLMSHLEGIVWSRLKPDQYIYRTITFKRLENIFVGKQNSLSRPSNWPDPFEDLLSKAIVKSALPGIGKFTISNYFGQCWTLHTASDAIWQIYSKGTDGVRVRTTVRKLLASIKSKVIEPNVRCHIGRVQYKRRKQLLSFGKTHFQDANDGNFSLSEKFAEAYMVKRNAFRHEKEVRLIYSGTLDISDDTRFFEYDVEPNVLFDQIMFHPKLTPSEHKTKSTHIRNLGFSGKIKESVLYKEPKGFVFHIGV